MKEGFKKWDVTEHLQTEEDINFFWEGIMEDSEGNPKVIMSALDVIARARNINQLARDTGLTRAGLYKALSGEGNPSFANVLKIVGALGLSLRIENIKVSGIS